MKIAIGSDHGGFDYKEELKTYLINKGYEVIDCGTYSKDSCNYAKFAIDTAIKVSNNEANFGIIICTSGEGVCIAANKVKGIRCGIGYNDDVARLLREHNDANVLAMGGRIVGDVLALEMVDIFLSTKFEGGRHTNRINSIETI